MIEILSSTALATVQDLGRDGYRRFGVGTSGAMDRLALAVGNVLLGNSEDAAGIEIPIMPFQLRFLGDIEFALTGADCDAKIDDRPIPPWWVMPASAGQVLNLQPPRSGSRCYVTVSGGIDVPVVLGSRSTHLRGKFGGFEGRTLAKGDVISAIGPPRGGAVRPLPAAGYGAESPWISLPLGEAGTAVTNVRVLPAAEYTSFQEESRQALWDTPWRVTPQSDRTGYRLAGPALDLIAPVEMRSHGIVPGVIQVPPGGHPIVQLADAATAGGYPKIGTVIDADIWRLAQTRLGSALRFVKTTYEEALAAFDDCERYLDRIGKLAILYRSRVQATAR